MIETKDITKMVAHIVRRDAGIPDASIMHPMREWVLGLTVVFFLVLGGVAFNVVMYRSYHDALFAPVEVTETVVPYRAAAVARAITYYEAERKTYESILGTRSVIEQAPAATSTSTSTTEATSTDSVPVIPGSVMDASTSAATTTSRFTPVVPQSSSSREVVPQPAG
jgi:hypothetical protein